MNPTEFKQVRQFLLTNGWYVAGFVLSDEGGRYELRNAVRVVPSYLLATLATNGGGTEFIWMGSVELPFSAVVFAAVCSDTDAWALAIDSIRVGAGA